jgi:hypothetical protein
VKLVGQRSTATTQLPRDVKNGVEIAFTEKTFLYKHLTEIRIKGLIKHSKPLCIKSHKPAQ